MHIVIDKTTNEIIYINNAAVDEALTDTEVYADFSADTMEIIKMENPRLANFKSPQAAATANMTDLQKIQEGLMTIDEAIDSYALGVEDAPEKIKVLVDNDCFTKAAHCEKAIDIIIEWTKKQIGEKFSLEYEIHLLKEYVAWLAEDKPSDDSRETEYLAAEKYINSIKNKIKPIAYTLKERIVQLSASESSTGNAGTST